MKHFAFSMRVGFAFVALFFAGSAHAGGLYLHSYGDPSLGTASAGENAIANDASTAHTNPAGMTRLDDHRFLGGLAPGFATVEFDPDGDTPSGGTDGGDQGGFVPIMSSSYVHKLSDRWRLGLSMVSLAGASLDPSIDWAGRFETTEVTLFSLSFMPVVAVRLTDWLSVGAGAAITYGKLELKLRAPVLMEPTIRGDDLDDWAAAAVASVLIEPTPNLRFGVVYQSETEFHLDGKIQIPVGVSPAVELELPLAQFVHASIYWDATDRIALVMNSGWEDWSAAKSLPLSASMGSTAIPLNFRDTWHIGAGGYYKLNDKLTLQTGFRYDSSALKDGDRTTFLPVDRMFTLGVGGLYDFSETLKIGLAFSWTSLGDSKVNNPTVKGEYSRNELFLFNVSLNWKKLPWSGRGTF
jgi:long-chain fatty acid transport protein